MGQTPTSLTLKSSEAILAVADVVATVRFYRDVLGFEAEWFWGNPPTFGGVRWGPVHVMFNRLPELAAKVAGHQHAIFCDDIDALHAHHQSRGAPIISPIENKPWGIREYVIRDPNGYEIRFGGPEKYEGANACHTQMPDYIRLEERIPTADESTKISGSLLSDSKRATLEIALRNSLFGVVAIDTRSGEVVGSLRVVGDGARFFYIQDVQVVTALQNLRIGSAMMNNALGWLKKTAPGASVGLFTGKAGFYERLGFQSGGGMSRQV